MNSLEKVLQLVSKTGMPAIILREGQEEPFVILSQKEYEDLLDVRKDMDTIVSFAEDQLPTHNAPSQEKKETDAVVDDTSDYYFSNNALEENEFANQDSKHIIDELQKEDRSYREDNTNVDNIDYSIADIEKELVPAVSPAFDVIQNKTTQLAPVSTGKSDDAWSSTKHILTTRYANNPESVVTKKENSYKEKKRKQYIKRRQQRNNAVFYDEPI